MSFIVESNLFFTRSAGGCKRKIRILARMFLHHHVENAILMYIFSQKVVINVIVLLFAKNCETKKKLKINDIFLVNDVGRQESR